VAASTAATPTMVRTASGGMGAAYQKHVLGWRFL
jgi:hypothetical protein